MEADHKGVTLDELLALKPPEPQSPRHHPAPHGAIAVAVLARLDEIGAHPEKVTWELDRDGMRLYGRIVLGGSEELRKAQEAVLRASRTETYTGINEEKTQAILERAGLAGAFAHAITISHANDRSMALRIRAAAEWFVCNNLAVGEAAGGFVKRRHTGHGDWIEMAEGFVDQVMLEMPEFDATLAKLAETEVNDQEAKSIFWDMLTVARRPVAPSVIEKTAETYFAHATPDVEHNTALAIHQALTRNVRGLGERREAQASQRYMRMLTDRFLAVEPDVNRN